MSVKFDKRAIEDAARQARKNNELKKQFEKHPCDVAEEYDSFVDESSSDDPATGRRLVVAKQTKSATGTEAPKPPAGEQQSKSSLTPSQSAKQSSHYPNEKKLHNPNATENA